MQLLLLLLFFGSSRWCEPHKCQMVRWAGWKLEPIFFNEEGQPLSQMGNSFQNFICEHENLLDAMPMIVDAN